MPDLHCVNCTRIIPDGTPHAVDFAGYPWCLTCEAVYQGQISPEPEMALVCPTKTEAA